MCCISLGKVLSHDRDDARKLCQEVGQVKCPEEVLPGGGLMSRKSHHGKLGFFPDWDDAEPTS